MQGASWPAGGWTGGGIVLTLAHAFNLLCPDVRAEPVLRSDALVRDRIAQLAAEIEVGRQLMMHCGELAEAGTTPPELGAISKVFSGELMERFGEAALDILGPRAALSQGAPGALRQGRHEQNLRHSLMWVISIGTNESQRSLIAQRALGLAALTALRQPRGGALWLSGQPGGARPSPLRPATAAPAPSCPALARRR